MSLLLLPATLLLAASGGQDPAALVDGMIERSNALKSFVATYAVRDPSSNDEREVTMRLVYRAPDNLLLEVYADAVRSRTVISGGVMSLSNEKAGHVQRGQAKESAASVLARASIARLFREKFPALGAIDGSTDLGVFVRFRFKAGTDSAPPESHLELGTGRGDSALLGWLEAMKRSKPQPATEAKIVVWDAAPGIRVSSQEATGFIDSVVVTHGGETKMVLELTNLAIDPNVEDSEFRTPEADPLAEDISESLSRAMQSSPLLALRAAIHREIRKAVESGTLEWTSEERTRLGTVLRNLHMSLAPLVCAESMSWARSAVDKFCAWYQQARRELPEGDVFRADRLEDACVDWDERFQAQLGGVTEPYLAKVIPEVAPMNVVTQLSTDIRTLELQEARAGCQEAVVEVSLDYYAKQMESAKNGQLTPKKD